MSLLIGQLDDLLIRCKGITCGTLPLIEVKISFPLQSELVTSQGQNCVQPTRVGEPILTEHRQETDSCLI